MNPPKTQKPRPRGSRALFSVLFVITALTPKFHYLQIQGVAAPRCSLLFVGIPQSIACRAAKQNDSEEEDGRGHRIDCDGVVGNARSSFETKDKGAAADNNLQQPRIRNRDPFTKARDHLQCIIAGLLLKRQSSSSISG